MTESANKPILLRRADRASHLGEAVVAACVLLYMVFCVSYLVAQKDGVLRLLFGLLFAAAPAMVWGISVKPDLFASLGLGKRRTLHLTQENRAVTAIQVVWISINYTAPVLAAMTWPGRLLVMLVWLSLGHRALEGVLTAANRHPMLAGWLAASASTAVLAAVLLFSVVWKGSMTWLGTACLVAADAFLFGWIIWRERGPSRT